MKVSKPRHWLVGLVTLISLVVPLVILFNAGCKGDTKGGAMGDPISALHYESVGLSFLLLGLTIGSALLISRERGEISWYGPVLFLFGGAGLWLLNMQVEAWAVQVCF